MSTSSLSSRSQALVNSGPFTAFITAVILVGAVLVGLEHKLAEMRALLEGHTAGITRSDAKPMKYEPYGTDILGW